MLKRVMIIAGESSGELYGSLLAKTLIKQNHLIEIRGVGGQKMESAGVKLISTISSAFGLTEALRSIGEIKKTFDIVLSEIRAFNPQVIVLIDYPDFNMRVAKEAKRLGVKVLYYVSPQVWAWRKRRVNKIGKLINKIAVILPFEEEIYKNANIPCEFVGHPILDEIREYIMSIGYNLNDIGNPDLKANVRKELGLTPDMPVIALMPGSRSHEIEKLMPVMSDVIRHVKEGYPDYQFVMPIAPNLNIKTLKLLNSEIGRHPELKVTNFAIKALLASDLAVIASGTSTLQSALLDVPMVVVYKLSPITFFIGKLLLNIQHISLVNVILDNSFVNETGVRVREFLQREANAKNITDEIRRLSSNNEYRNNILSQFQKIKGLFMNKSASLRVAEIINEMAS